MVNFKNTSSIIQLLHTIDEKDIAEKQNKQRNMSPTEANAYTKDESIQERPRGDEGEGEVESGHKMPETRYFIVLPDRFHSRINSKASATPPSAN